MEKISEKIWAEIAASGQSMYAVAQAAGVDQATLSRWQSGQRGISLETAERLAEFLGLELVRPVGDPAIVSK